jgi:hypothetical protein
MNDADRIARAGLLTAAALLIAGCHSSRTPAGGAHDAADETGEHRNVTFYLAGMNRRLKIL